MAGMNESKPCMLLVFATIGPGTDEQQDILQENLIEALKNADACSASSETKVLEALGYFD